MQRTRTNRVRVALDQEILGRHLGVSSRRSTNLRAKIAVIWLASISPHSTALLMVLQLAFSFLDVFSSLF